MPEKCCTPDFAAPGLGPRDSPPDIRWNRVECSLYSTVYDALGGVALEGGHFLFRYGPGGVTGEAAVADDALAVQQSAEHERRAPRSGAAGLQSPRSDRLHHQEVLAEAAQAERLLSELARGGDVGSKRKSNRAGCFPALHFGRDRKRDPAMTGLSGRSSR